MADYYICEAGSASEPAIKNKEIFINRYTLVLWVFIKKKVKGQIIQFDKNIVDNIWNLNITNYVARNKIGYRWNGSQEVEEPQKY